ncbi:transcriptional regulator, AraC family [Octadecabacter temperatus]|uniref:DNA-binding transcriptional activator FeaR n=1 Tax=Octadecabacter temperatus TaxID=1458307 RepID=A0A0K0Y7W4_9RHOB|nr:helix-turn-helix domain-containing protein [Octadecabacter temperatus]AKS47005.1 DNA-binding transcriptional activator FeaR [Octadecabacter temperatus]SIO25073.1 transcriptional regulator, AraC family [Octadecabacter temperatus]
MPSLPIPLISSLVLGFLLLRMWLVDRRHGPLVLLLALCAVQGVIISMAQHYRVPGTLVLQPIIATFVPAMAWVAFQTTAVRNFQRSDLVHMAGPLLAVGALVTQPYLLDTLIPALFVGYGIAILWRSLKGADALPRLRLDAGDLPGRIWTIIGVALIGSAFTDVLIVAVQILGAAHLQPWIISIYSSAMLLVIGALSLSGALENAPSEEDETPEQEITELDTQIVARLDKLMAGEQLYLNPDLTLSRLSRRLIIPVKQLSTAINKVTGENVSRYINAARIKAAQDALVAGESVTNAMLASGFNTKSNFNREFLRVVGVAPSDWRSGQA